MPRFTGAAYDSAPLLIQLKSTVSGAGSYATVFAVKAETQTDSGTVSRPILFRPSVPGVPIASTTGVRGRVPGESPSVVLATSFTANPGIPIVNSGSFPLPIRISWMVPPEAGWVISGGGAIVLYAVGSSGATWSGSLSWEEA